VFRPIYVITFLVYFCTEIYAVESRGEKDDGNIGATFTLLLYVKSIYYLTDIRICKGYYVLNFIIIIIIIIVFPHGLGLLTCSGIDALSSFHGASTDYISGSKIWNQCRYCSWICASALWPLTTLQNWKLCSWGVGQGYDIHTGPIFCENPSTGFTGNLRRSEGNSKSIIFFFF
jgi:hypothetical protein